MHPERPELSYPLAFKKKIRTGKRQWNLREIALLFTLRNPTIKNWSGDWNERESLTYRFTNHFHIGIHGFCGKGITTKYKVLILCKKDWKVDTSHKDWTFSLHKNYWQLHIEHDRNGFIVLPRFLTSSMTILARNSVAFPEACSILKSTLEISSCIQSGWNYGECHDVFSKSWWRRIKT